MWKNSLQTVKTLLTLGFDNEKNGLPCVLKSTRSSRCLFYCTVHGPQFSGKSSLISTLLNSNLNYSPDKEVITKVTTTQGQNKYIVLKEISTFTETKINKELFEKVDCSIFCFDGPNQDSLNASISDQKKFSEQYKIPILFVATRMDTDTGSSNVPQKCQQYCQENGLSQPVLVICPTKRVGPLWNHLLSLSKNPSLSLPKKWRYSKWMKLAVPIISIAIVGGVVLIYKYSKNTKFNDNKQTQQPVTPTPPKPTRRFSWLDSQDDDF
eukprot:c27867_g1_i1.p1 GENE.c27867_g1_i1~~c27867_g1_i1.p1  ORF type:complete len:267 (+),score=121.24 c27867_g1_i1:139-939(+)